MSFRGGSGEKRGRCFNREREKTLVVSRGDGGRHQASDEAHASSFPYRGRKEEDLLLGISNIFIVKNMATQLNFAGRKLKMRRRKN